MALDSLFLSGLNIELRKKLRNGKIDKIYQPQPLDIVLSMRQNQDNYRLIISAHPQYARAHLTQREYENPLTPPSFCMLLRKYLENSRLIDIEQPNFERILRFYFQTIYPIDGISQLVLVVEIMGKHSNIILLNRQNSTILGAIKILNQQVNRFREIYPGIKYTAPPDKNKINPLEVTESQFIAKVSSELLQGNLNQTLMENFTGFSPLLTKEIIYRAGLKPDIASPLSSQQLGVLWDSFVNILGSLKSEKLEPSLFIKKESNQVVDFSLIELQQFESYSKKAFPSPSTLLDYYYGQKQSHDYLQQKKKELISVVQRELKRCLKKQSLQEKDLAKAQKAEIFKVKGELILANLYQINKGESLLKTTNYYEADNPEVEIELDPKLTPSTNAQAYFKKYNKAKNSLIYLKEQMKINQEEKDYLEAVLASLERIEEVRDLALIREELQEEKYLRVKPTGKKNKVKNAKLLPQPLKFISSDGLEILVGKNNKENDYLTLKLAHSQDLWLHVKDIPGSHVVIRTNNNNNIPEQTLVEAAHLAAYYSKAKSSGQVPIDYTRKKYVKKPNGAKPGMVIYQEQKTLFITPNQQLIEKLKLIKKKQ